MADGLWEAYDGNIISPLRLADPPNPLTPRPTALG
jgi:hypothetical protein